MCEYLASHGYVVAAHPSFGPRPNLMTTESLDLERQARDLEFVIGRMESAANVDSARIAVLGHSWGGMAGLLAASRNSKIRVVVSLDGSEEMWRDLLDASPEFDPATFTAPYLRLTNPASVNAPDFGLFDSIQHGPKYRVLLDPSVGHFDFVSSRILSRMLRGEADLENWQKACQLVSRYVLSFLEAYLREDAKAAAFLASDAGGKAISDKLVAVEATPAGPQILTEAAVIDLVMTKGIDEALEHLRQAIAQDPVLFSEQRLTRVAEQLLWTGQYDEEALALLALVVERFPGAARAYEMMGNVYFWNMGDYEAARTHYRRAAELDRTLRIENYLEQLEALLPP